jgi:hypothetical protein
MPHLVPGMRHPIAHGDDEWELILSSAALNTLDVCPPSRRSPSRLVALVLGLIISAVLLSNWKLRFAVDAPDFYAELYDEAAAEVERDTLGWLVSAAYGYHNLRRANAKRVRIMGVLLTVLGALMVLQTIFWLVALR